MCENKTEKLFRIYAIIAQKYIYATKNNLTQDGVEKQLMAAGFKFPKVK
jgi:hypothetical protein